MGFQWLPSGFLKLPIDIGAKSGKNLGTSGSIKQEGFHFGFTKSPSIC